MIASSFSGYDNSYNIHWFLNVVGIEGSEKGLSIGFCEKTGKSAMVAASELEPVLIRGVRADKEFGCSDENVCFCTECEHSSVELEKLVESKALEAVLKEEEDLEGLLDCLEVVNGHIGPVKKFDFGLITAFQEKPIVLEKEVEE